jgi:hypothetical protein
MSELSNFDKGVIRNTRKFGNFVKDNPWIKWVIIGGLGLITFITPILGLFLITMSVVFVAIIWNILKKI